MPPVKVEGGGEQLDWGESLTKTKEETAQQKKWGTYIYILSFFLGGGCLGKLSLFIFQTLEVPSCEVFRAWLLGCDIFFFFDFLDDFWRIMNWPCKDPTAWGAATGGSFRRGNGLHWKSHQKTLWNNVKPVEVMWNGTYLWYLTWYLWIHVLFLMRMGWLSTSPIAEGDFEPGRSSKKHPLLKNRLHFGGEHFPKHHLISSVMELFSFRRQEFGRWKDVSKSS